MSLIIFDCDGVLVESEAVLIEAELDFLSRAGLTFERDAYIRRFMGMAPAQWRQELGVELKAVGAGTDVDEFFDTLHAVTDRTLKRDLVSVAGARHAIEALNAQICVASSSSPVELEWKLSNTGLLDLFTPHLFSTQLVARGKPAPDLFLLAAERMGVPPDACVVVEDSSNGVVAAKAAGMRAVGLVAGTHCPVGHANTLSEDGADVVVESYVELRGAIAAL